MTSKTKLESFKEYLDASIQLKKALNTIKDEKCNVEIISFF